MAEQFAFQCQYCGTSYNHPQANCPYCGERQPFTREELEMYAAAQHGYDDQAEESLDDGYYDDDPYAAHDHDPNHLPYEDPHYQDDYLPEEEPYPDEMYAQPDHFDPDTQYVDDYADDPYLPNEEAYHEPTYYNEAAYQDETVYADDPNRHYTRDYQQYTQGGYQPAVEPAAPAAAPAPRRLTWRRAGLGCLGILVCIGLFYGGLGLLAVREGLQERAVLVQDEADDHYQKGLEHLDNQELDLAIAEFELALSINPNSPEIREELRQAQQLTQSQPTATSQTLSNAAAKMLIEAKAQLDEEDWATAAETLTDIRDLDPTYEAAEISDLIFEANYQLGLQYVDAEEIEEAQRAFEQALAERPDDPKAVVAHTKALLYLEGLLVEPVDAEQAVDNFGQLYEEDKAYLDVEQRYMQALESLGDILFEETEWCQAKEQYLAAQEIKPSRLLETKITNVTERCETDDTQTDTPEAETGTAEATEEAATPSTGAPTRPAATSPALAALDETETGTETDDATAEPDSTEEATTEPAVDAAPVASALGSIIYSKYNPYEHRWEIVSLPADGSGSPRVLVTNGQMPSLSIDGTLLLYRTDRPDSIGLHIYNLTTGEDDRITIYQEHISPKWGPGNTDYIFSARELGTGRWQYFQGFADGKGDPNILGDGRTPAWSPKGDLVAYQGTDAQGNNPGIYAIPFGGGDTIRLSTHESDRSPAFSPNGSQIAYMSTRNGNWDIFAVGTGGGDTPRQITTSPGNDGLPTWSPDGSQIAYVSDTGGRWGIYRISAQGGDPIRITDWDGLKQEDWLMAQIWWGP